MFGPNFRFRPKVRFFKCCYFGFGVSAKKLFRLTTTPARERDGGAVAGVDALGAVDAAVGEGLPLPELPVPGPRLARLGVGAVHVDEPGSLGRCGLL